MMKYVRHVKLFLKLLKSLDKFKNQVLNKFNETSHIQPKSLSNLCSLVMNTKYDYLKMLKLMDKCKISVHYKFIKTFLTHNKFECDTTFIHECNCNFF